MDKLKQLDSIPSYHECGIYGRNKINALNNAVMNDAQWNLINEFGNSRLKIKVDYNIGFCWNFSLSFGNRNE